MKSVYIFCKNVVLLINMGGQIIISKYYVKKLKGYAREEYLVNSGKMMMVMMFTEVEGFTNNRYDIIQNTQLSRLSGRDGTKWDSF